MAKKKIKIPISNSKTKVCRCKCVHEYQDKKYGKGRRLGNKKDNERGTYSCTVCGSEIY